MDRPVHIDGESAPVGRGVNRRDLLRGSGLVVGAGALAAACTSKSGGDASAASAAAGSQSLLTKIQKDKKLRLGVDLTFPPLQFKDPKNRNKPSGYMIEITEMLAKDLGATPQYVEVPFGQLFAAQVAGKFDFGGIAATILPSRALKVLFCSEPVFIESVVIMLKPGLKINALDDLNRSSATIAVLLGSSQESSAPLLFPKAKLKSLDYNAAIEDVASGRSDAMLQSNFAIEDTLNKHPKLTVFNGPPAFVDYNTYFLPPGDLQLQGFIDNWLRYQTSHGVLEGLWNKWIGNGAKRLGLPTVPVTSPFVPNGASSTSSP